MAMLDMNEDLLLEYQCEFRLGRGYTDQRFTLQLLIDQSNERSHPLYSAFVDLEKAFDRVDRSVLGDIMRSYGYDDTTIAKAMDLHDGTTAKVKWGGKSSEPVPTSWGVQQGAPVSNPLWNLYADLI